MSAISNLYIDQGSDFSVTVGMTDATSAALDLTGATFLAQIRKTHSSSTVTATFGSSHDSTGGNLTLTLADTVTAGITSGRYVYDVLITDSGNTATRVVEGSVLVRQGVTQ